MGSDASNTPKINSSKEGVMLSLFKTMLDENIIYAYQGPFSYQVVVLLLKEIKTDMEQREIEKAIAIKAYNVLVESLENVYRHSTAPEGSKLVNEGMFVLAGKNDELTVTVGNIVSKEDARDLERNLLEIKGLSKEELRKRYNYIITNGSISEKGGAGLGLLDIALKSNNNIDYDFHTQSEDRIIFILKIMITKIKPV